MPDTSELGRPIVGAALQGGRAAPGGNPTKIQYGNQPLSQPPSGNAERPQQPSHQFPPRNFKQQQQAVSQPYFKRHDSANADEHRQELSDPRDIHLGEKQNERKHSDLLAECANHHAQYQHQHLVHVYASPGSADQHANSNRGRPQDNTPETGNQQLPPYYAIEPAPFHNPGHLGRSAYDREAACKTAGELAPHSHAQANFPSSKFQHDQYLLNQYVSSYFDRPLLTVI